jgi:hypothetical protein
VSLEFEWRAQDSAWDCYNDVPIVSRTAAAVMGMVTCGDDGPWCDELSLLWKNDQHAMLQVLNSVLAEGFRSPIIIGNDGRLWDGHHRLAVALALDIEVPTRTVAQCSE